MILKELLDKPELQGINIKIHAVDGSCHVFAYKNTKYYLKRAEHEILREDRNLLIKKNRKLFKLQIDLKETTDKLLKNKCKKNIVAFKKQIKNVKWDISHPLLTRKVVEKYEGIIEEEKPCLIVCVEGHENGKYWSVEEYKRTIGRWKKLD